MAGCERQHTNFKVVLVRKGVVNSCCLWYGLENLLAHLVHGVLNRRGILLSKGLHGD